MKKFLPFLTLVFFIGLIAISTYKLSKKQKITSSETAEEFGIHFIKTKIALPEFSLPDLFDEEKNFSRNDVEGKYSLVNFFASWCVTCHAEHEILLRLRDEKIIDIYGVAWRDISENTKKYLKKNGNPFNKVANDSGGLFTKIAGIEAIPETWIVDSKGKEREAYDKEVAADLQERSAELICLIGYMRILSEWFVKKYRGHIINVHPSLLPKFAGGMGINVHEEVLKAGEKETGCTIHFVTEAVDGGPIIVQKKVPVLPNDTAETLKERVQAAEKTAYPEAIKMFIKGQIKFNGH